MEQRTSIDRGAIAGAGLGFGLLICMFAFAWYGVDGIPGRGSGIRVVSTESGWDGLSVIRWLMLVTVCVAAAAGVREWRERATSRRARDGGWVAALGLTTSLLLVYRVLIALPDAARVPDQKLGAILGLLLALGITLAGWDSVRHARDLGPGQRRARTPAGRDGEEPGRSGEEPGRGEKEPGHGGRTSS